MNTKEIGEHIAMLRKNAGLTQESLSERLGVTPQAVSKWERGAGLPDISVLMDLAFALDVNTDDLLKPTETPIRAFMRSNKGLLTARKISGVPKISRWDAPQGCDMFYSMPAMIAAALCKIEAAERGDHEPLSYEMLNSRFCELMHVMGLGYAFLWFENRNLAEELWRAFDYGDIIKRAMNYYGRDYLFLKEDDATPQQRKQLLVWSIDHGHPVVMEGAGGIAEFSVITGYADGGDTLIGWTYCEEFVTQTDTDGSFIHPARWEEEKPKMLVIGDKVEPTYSDKDSLLFALEALDYTEVGKTYYEQRDKQYGGKGIAGDAAYRKWLDECTTPDGAEKVCRINDMLPYALERNSIYAPECALKALKKMSERHPAQMNLWVTHTVNSFHAVKESRDAIDHYEGEDETFAELCRKHINDCMGHRENTRNNIREMLKVL